MKIVSCFSKLSEIKPLIEAGADELYCAIKPLDSFGRGVLPAGRLQAAADRIHALGGKLAVAANSMALLRDERGLRRFSNALLKADEAGVDAFIISNPSIFELIKNLKRPLRAKTHLSSVQPCFNSLAARVFIRRGISRLILPNQLSPKESAGIFAECRRAGVETEIFDYRFFGCTYVNGRCNLHNPVYHSFAGDLRGAAPCNRGIAAGCGMKTLNILPERSAEIPAIWTRFSARLARGGSPRIGNAAAFFDFFSMGADYLKYGTRRDDSRVKIRKAAELRRMLDLARALTRELGRNAARNEFVRRMTSWNGLEER
jgi:collagenase-like PrtC family protease